MEVAPDGEILSVVTDVQQMDHSPMTEFYGGVMVAGFVNGHSHLELAYLRDAIPSGSGFAGFASKIGEVRGRYTMEQRVAAIKAADHEMAAGGIVAVGDVINGDSSFEVKGSSSIKYKNFAELFGLRATDSSAVDGLLGSPNTTITQHSLYSLNDKLFRQVAESKDDAPLSIHFMESPSELELFEGRGALYEWYRRVGFECDFLHYGSPAKRLISSVPHDRSVMLIHNCCVRREDVELILNHFTAPIYWVVCPQSNRFISGLKPPVELLQSMGCNICVGTDSLASNWSLSMVDELRAMDNVPLVKRLDWATRQGAKALGFNHLGDIAVGKRPHINILSALDYNTMELTADSIVTPIL